MHDEKHVIDLGVRSLCFQFTPMYVVIYRRQL